MASGARGAYRADCHGKSKSRHIPRVFGEVIEAILGTEYSPKRILTGRIQEPTHADLVTAQLTYKRKKAGEAVCFAGFF